MRNLNIPIAEVFEELLDPSLRYLGAFGGRGGGKSHFFAERLITRALTQRKLRAVCIREVQLTLKESSKRLIEDKLLQLGLTEDDGFKIMHDSIITPGGGIISFIGMQDQNAENIKSLEGYDIAWVEEAQTLSARSLQLLRPTIRKPGSQIWFSWNARRKTDAVDVMLRSAELPTNTCVVKCNYSENPWFPAILEQERLDCMRLQPDQYGHIWEGEYMSILTGAYYAQHISAARTEGRIARVAADPLLPIKLFWDIGGTGARSDACSIWAAQFIGKEIRVLNYYEAQGQDLATHLTWLRASGYDASTSTIYLPHDGVQHDKVFAVSYQSALEQAGYTVTVVKNQGQGAAMARVAALRRLFPNMWFNEDTTVGGIDALSWYHAKIDEVRQIDLGPEHDWASHGADAAGLMAVVAEIELKQDKWNNEIDYSRMDRQRVA